MSELEHIKTIITEGVYKAPVLESGGLLLAEGKQIASIILGQDMSVGFVGPQGKEVEFSISESITPLIIEPGAICILK